MKNKRIIYLIFVCALHLASNAVYAQSLTCRVVDAETKEPLPGVAVFYNQTLVKGVFTDNNGYFVIPKAQEIERLNITLIGYVGRTFQAYEIPREGKMWVIELTPRLSYLDEVKVVAGENPALRIVRNAIANRKSNNPRFYPSYTYTSYNKNIVVSKTVADAELSERNMKRFSRDTARSKDQHILVIESVTKKWYKSPNLNKEEVIATKISGFENPGVAATPDAIQNFAFHENIIPLVNKKWLNPIADGADKNYFYILTDTIIKGRDTVYIMDYHPRIGSNFESFKGKIHISTNKWALVSITAAPFDEGKVNLYLEQDYFLVDGYWFPKHMNFELELERVPLTPNGAVMIGKTTLDSVQIGIPIRDDFFDHIAVIMSKDAAKVNAEFWETYRPQPLSPQEIRTYEHMDSVGKRFHFDALLKSTRNVYEGFIAVGKFDVEMNKILAFSEFEGLRLGMGLYTNQDIWQKLRLGGYVGYGFRDPQLKYGFSGRYYFNRMNDFFITASYVDDVRDPGGIRIKYYEWGNVAQQFFNVLMDRVQETELSVTFRPQKYSLLKLSARHFELTPTYDYTFKTTSDIAINQFSFTELQLNYRWQHREKFSTNFGPRISEGSKFPVVSLMYSRGLGAEFNSDLMYNKLEAGLSFNRYIKKFGRLRFSFEGGYIDRPLPWSMNFSGRPSFNPSFSVVVRNTFQTMRFNEFSSDVYGAMFFMHDFGPLLIRTKKFKPEVRIAHAMTIGSLRSPELHQGVDFKTLEKGYLESGLILDNLIRINMMNAGYIGFGAGVFYRYGAYHLPVERDNYTFKFAVMYSIN